MKSIVRKIRKYMAFMLATGFILSSVTVYASGYNYIQKPNDLTLDTGAIFGSHNGQGIDYDFSQNGIISSGEYIGIEPPASADNGSWFYHMEKGSDGKYHYQGDYCWDGAYWVRDGGAYT